MTTLQRGLFFRGMMGSSADPEKRWMHVLFVQYGSCMHSEAERPSGSSYHVSTNF